MTIQDDIKTVLTANAPLVAAFTGGIKTFDELGGIGINVNSFPSAFDSNLQLKPLIVIRERAIIPTREIADEDSQATSITQSVDIHFMQDRRLGWGVAGNRASDGLQPASVQTNRAAGLQLAEQFAHGARPGDGQCVHPVECVRHVRNHDLRGDCNGLLVRHP